MDDSDFDGDQELGDSGSTDSTPDNPIRQSERDSVAPTFLNTPSKAESNAARPAHLGPAAGLKKAEKDAAKGGAGNNESDDDKRAAHVANLAEKAGGVVKPNFFSMVVGRVKKKGDKSEKGSFNKSIATIVVIVVLVGGFVGFSFFGQAMQPFALVNNLIKSYNISSISMNARFNTTMYASLRGKNIEATTEFKAHLKEVGIEIDTDENGKIKGYSYKSSDGTIKTITNAEEFQQAVKNDSEFSSKLSKASEIADTQSWWGKVKSYAAERIGFNRNRFDEIDHDDTKTKAESDADFKERVAGDQDVSKSEIIGYKDKDGNAITEEQYRNATPEERKSFTPVTQDGKVKTEVEYKQTLDSVAEITDNDEIKIRDDMVGKIGEVEEKVNASGKLGAGSKALSGGVCAFSGVGQAVAAITIGKMVIEMVNLASGILESVQRCQAGDGNCRSMHGYFDVINVGDFFQAVTMLSVFGSKTANTQSATVGNLENIFNNKGVAGKMAAVSATHGSWKNCLYARQAAAWIDIVGDIKDVVMGIATSGISLIIKGIAKSIAVSTAISAAVSSALKGVIRIALNVFRTNVIDNLGSMVSGEYAGAGAKYIFSTMGKASGLSLTSLTNFLNFGQYKDEVIALRAKYDRDNLSPFDISSPNTFLGSIVNSIATFSVLNSSSYASIMRTMSAISNVTSMSLASVLPQASATPYENSADAPGDCPLVNDIGAVANANSCVPTYAPAMDSLPISYEDAKENLGTRNLNSDGSIVEDGELAKFIVYGTQRDTHPGLADGNIQKELHILETGNSTLDSMIGAVPVVGSAIDIANTKIDADNQGIIFGSDYVIDGEHWNDPANKKILDSAQAYVELDTLYEELGLIEHSVVADFLDKYYQKNPVDTSYEGTLARISGLTKDEVVNTLAYMDYVEYANNYQSLGRYVFGGDEKPIIVNQKNGKPEAMPVAEITYFDLRSINLVA